MHENTRELMEYRLQMAEEKLHVSEILLHTGNYKDSIGRSYYAMFQAVRALLALDEVDFKKHAGVISYFQEHYIKTQVFDKKYSKYLSKASRIRNNVDYADFYIVSKEDAEKQYANALDFYTTLKIYLEKRT